MKNILYIILLMSLSANAQKIGDVKQGVQASDHNGWYLMDGRTAASIGGTAQANANSIGITTLVNMQNRFVKQKSTGESLGSTGGNSSIKLTQANLPDYKITATITDGGAHSHTWKDKNDRLSGGNGRRGEAHKHNNVPITRTLSTVPNHTHKLPNIPSGGTSKPIAIVPSSIAVNYFIYLGE